MIDHPITRDARQHARPLSAGAFPGGRQGCVRRSILVIAAVTAVASAGCGAAAGPAGTPGTAGTAGRTGQSRVHASAAPSARAVAARTRRHANSPGGPVGSSGGGGQAKPLAGVTVGIDPGHNGRNGTDPAYLNRQVWNGREWEDCDTTGTETDSGYTEALFNFRVAGYLRADLRRLGARVVLTRRTNHGLGPCVNRRSQIINRAHARVAVDIHADGGPPGGRGFAILEPVADGPNDHVIAASERLGRDVRTALLTDTGMPESTYDGVHGINHRDDLAGLNLTRVPKVLIECGNMRNATDARLLTSARFQRELARAFTATILRFLRKR